MLRLSPTTCLPDSELANSLKLFTPEIRRQDIKISYTTDPGYYDIDVSWAKVSFQPISAIFPHEADGPPSYVVFLRAIHWPSSWRARLSTQAPAGNDILHSLAHIR
jgi:hypothetical protein